jgi:hypothetical protein
LAVRYAGGRGKIQVDERTISLLLDFKASPRDIGIPTQLSLPLMSRLLVGGANPNSMSRTFDGCDRSILWLCVSARRTEHVKLLISHGASTNSERDADGSTILHGLISTFAEPRVEIARLLLESHKPPDVHARRTSTKTTALQEVLIWMRLSGGLPANPSRDAMPKLTPSEMLWRMAAILVDAGADPCDPLAPNPPASHPDATTAAPALQQDRRYGENEWKLVLDPPSSVVYPSWAPRGTHDGCLALTDIFCFSRAASERSARRVSVAISATTPAATPTFTVDMVSHDIMIQALHRARLRLSDRLTALGEQCAISHISPILSIIADCLYPEAKRRMDGGIAPADAVVPGRCLYQVSAVPGYRTKSSIDRARREDEVASTAVATTRSL